MVSKLVDCWLCVGFLDIGNDAINGSSIKKVEVGDVSTYDHRSKNLALPVCSAVLKLGTGGLVVRWVTTGESLLSYVFFCIFVFLSLIITSKLYTQHTKKAVMLVLSLHCTCCHTVFILLFYIHARV